MFRHTEAGIARAKGTAGQGPRARLLAATIQTVALRGYWDASVSELVSASGLDEAVFNEHFEGKRDCFVQAIDEILRAGERAALELFELELPWSERVKLGLQRLLGALAEHPLAARVLLVDAYGAGPEPYERLRRACMLLVEFMERGRNGSPSAAQLPAETSETIVGGVLSILQRRVLQGNTDELSDLLGDLVYFALLPYLESEQASRVSVTAQQID